MQTRSALLLGASGLIGGFCLDALLNEATYDRIVVLVRRRLPRSSPKLDQHIVDFGRLKEYAGLMAVNDVFCCLGTTIKQAGSRETFHKVDCTYPLEIAHLALQQGARQFLVVTAMGADPHSRVFYNRVKGEVEVKLSHLGYFGLHIFRPSLLLGKHYPSRPGEDLAQLIGAPLARIMIGPLKKYRPIEAKTVAEAMVRTAQRDYRGIFIYPSDRIAQR
ncbi:MAG: oxidoreductase [Syntrophaceae bacterium]